MTTLLVLGGSGVARRWTNALAAHIEERGLVVRIVYALAGATEKPRVPKAPVEVRQGGFGGAQGLREWLENNRAALLVDATHPFATRMSENAEQAVRALSVPLFRVSPPRFPRTHAKKRFEAHDSGGLSDKLPEKLPKKLPKKLHSLVASLPVSYRRRVFCALGAQRIVPLVRLMPARLVLLRSFASTTRQRDLCLRKLRLRRARVLRVSSMPPFSAQSVRHEMRMLKRERVSLLLCRDSGARESFAKVVAARRLSVPVVVISPFAIRGSRATVLSPQSVLPVVRFLELRACS